MFHECDTSGADWKGIAEQWCDDMGIPTYTMDRETGIVKDNKTGNTSKPKKTSHIKIVK